MVPFVWQHFKVNSVKWISVKWEKCQTCLIEPIASLIFVIVAIPVVLFVLKKYCEGIRVFSRVYLSFYIVYHPIKQRKIHRIDKQVHNFTHNGLYHSTRWTVHTCCMGAFNAHNNIIDLFLAAGTKNFFNFLKILMINGTFWWPNYFQEIFSDGNTLKLWCCFMTAVEGLFVSITCSVTCW